MNIWKILYSIFPSFARWGLLAKISATAILGGLCLDLFYARINPAFSLLKSALSFSPVEEAKNLAEKGQLKSCEEYIDFYIHLPGVSPSKELLELRQNIYNERHGLISGAMHQAKHMMRGLKGEESDEWISNVSDIAADFVPFVGDGRDLYNEYNNYSRGKEVDYLILGLAGVSLALDLAKYTGYAAGAVTGGTSAVAANSLAPLQRLAHGLNKTSKMMNAKLKKSFIKLFDPVMSGVKKVFAKMPSVYSPGEMIEFAKKNAKSINNIIETAGMRLKSVVPFISLAEANPAALKVILNNAASVEKASELARMALKLGGAGKDIFRFGGKAALSAVETLGKAGQISADVLRASMRVGATGLRAVAKGCWKSLNRILELIHKYAPLLWWFMWQYFLAKMPFWLAIILEALGILALAKTWSGTLFKNRQTAAV